MGLYISASMIDDFISCNKKVYYRQNKSEYQIQNKEMIIGDVVHASIEKFWDNPEKAIEYVRSEISTRLPQEFATSFGFAQTCLNNFFQSFQGYLLPTDEVEKKFLIPYGKDIYIVGRMDRISNGNVFDWKTARKPKTDISKEVQFILYNWAYKNIYKKEATGVYYAALTTGNLVRYSPNHSATKILFDNVIPQLIVAMKNGDYTPNGIFRGSCFRCSYSETCLQEVQLDVMDSTASPKK